MMEYLVLLIIILKSNKYNHHILYMSETIIRDTYVNPEYKLMNSKKLYERLNDKGVTHRQV